MMKTKTIAIVLASSLVSTNLVASDEFDSDLLDILNMKSELKADVGSRSGSKNFLESRSAVDVITHEQIASSGFKSLTNVLRYFVAGFNAPEPSITDGSDHVRAFTLRGMGPDQTLILLNGKRLHTSSLLHVNGTIGRGSSNVDLDTIPVKAIEKIEILRDGAAAQYGSDAISGVINIILKGGGHKNSIDVHTGVRSKGDGKLAVVDSFITTPLKYDGFVNLTLMATDQEQTQRAGTDRRLDPPRVITHSGIADAKNFHALLNIEAPQDGDIVLYSNAHLNYKKSEASAFFRPPDHNEATKEIYPRGFLPMIGADILDYSALVGINGVLANEISWDLSNRFGHNKIDYSADNSMNYSLGKDSPTSFFIGSLEFMQNTTNLDLKKNVGSFELAGGTEYRYERYSIEQGDTASYAGTGSQGFAGYTDGNEIENSRDSYALYLNTLYHYSEDLSLEGAARYENYRDFGETTNVKVAASYKPREDLMLRSSTSTGFRAPSLTQSSYSHISTFARSDGLSTEGTFIPSNPISRSFGAQDLKAEQSEHFSGGFVYRPTKKISFMVDYFYTKVNDRIMISGDMTRDDLFANEGVNKARFFTNAVDTKTQGVDIRYNQVIDFENSSDLDLGIWYHYAKNEIVSFNDTTTISREGSFEQVDRVENGQPKDAIRVLSKYSIDKFIFTLNLSRYGSYSHVVNDKSYMFKPRITSDFDIAYNLSKTTTLNVGGHNIFDTYPNKWDGLSGEIQGYDGIKPYSRYSPFGYSGSFYYATANIKF